MMKQKVEIELQNIEITDSINYAKRIQTSILPDFNKLKEACADAFLFFRPRDIVSGDFYWFDKFDEDKYIIVCADSTGHGVPGAFMSMIGSTLLQDIVTRQRITKPSVVLKMLYNQKFTTEVKLLNWRCPDSRNRFSSLIVIGMSVSYVYLSFCSWICEINCAFPSVIP